MLLEPARTTGEWPAGGPRSAGRSRRRRVLSRAQGHHAVGDQTTAAHGGAGQPQRAPHRTHDGHNRAAHRRRRDHPPEGVPACHRNSRAMATVPCVGGKGASSRTGSRSTCGSCSRTAPSCTRTANLYAYRPASSRKTSNQSTGQSGVTCDPRRRCMDRQRGPSRARTPENPLRLRLRH